MRRLFVIDPPERLNAAKDSSVALMRAYAKRGDEIWHTPASGLGADSAGFYAAAERLKIFPEDSAWFAREQSAHMRADDFACIWMRKEPPANDDYMVAARLLELAQTPVYNSPRALRDLNEKLCIFNFPQLIPPTWAGASFEAAAAFHREHGAVALKPLNGFAGRGVYLAAAKDRNFRAVFDLLSDGGKSVVMAQKYLPAGQDGDSRVFLINGKPCAHMLRRIPRADDFRGNLAAGGEPRAAPLGAAERKTAEAAGERLLAAGVVFAGLDIIDGRLIEANITCPTGLRETTEQSGHDIAQDIIAALP